MIGGEGEGGFVGGAGFVVAMQASQKIGARGVKEIVILQRAIRADGFNQPKPLSNPSDIATAAA